MDAYEYQELKRLEELYKQGKDVSTEIDKFNKQFYPDPIDQEKTQYYVDLINMSDAAKRQWYVNNIEKAGNIGDIAMVARQVLEPVDLAAERKRELIRQAQERQEKRQAEIEKTKARTPVQEKRKDTKAIQQQVMMMAPKVAQTEVKKTQLQERRQPDIKEKLSYSAQQTPLLPPEARYYENIDFGNNAGRTIYRALTPWTEEKGETVETYIEAIPDMYTGKYDTQERLKERYEAEQSNPLWVRILLGGETVIKRPDGKYAGIMAGEAPLITPAKSGVKLTQTIAVNYNKILESARKSRLAAQWQKTLTYLKAGERIEQVTKQAGQAARNLEKLQSAAREAKNTAKVNASINRLIQEEINEYNKYQAQIAAKLAKMQAEQKKPLLLAIPGLYINPEMASKEITKTLSGLSATKALQELNKTGLTATYALTNPEILTRFLLNAETSTRNKTITELKTSTKTATQTMTQTQLKRINKIIQDILEKSRQQEQTKTETETQTETSTQTQTATQTQTKTKTQVKPEIQTQTQTKTKTDTGTRTETPKTPTPPARVTISGTPTPPEPPLKIPVKITLPLGVGKRDIERILEKRLPVVWRQGFGWWVIKYPYKHERDMYFTKRKPSGAFELKGVGSAYRTIQALGGNPKILVRKNLGIVDVVVSENKIRFIRKKNINRRKRTPELIKRR